MVTAIFTACKWWGRLAQRTSWRAVCAFAVHFRRGQLVPFRRGRVRQLSCLLLAATAAGHGCAKKDRSGGEKHQAASAGLRKQAKPAARTEADISALQLTFVAAGRSPRRQALFGCELRRERRERNTRFSVVLGDMRRARAAHGAGVSLHPGLFSYPEPIEGHRVELHTTTLETAPHAEVRRGAIGSPQRVTKGAQPPRRWAVSCVLRPQRDGEDGAIAAIDAMVFGDHPKLLGQRTLDAAQATPAALQRYLAQLVAR